MQLLPVHCLAHVQTVKTLVILLSSFINCPSFASPSHFAPTIYAGPQPLFSQSLNLRAPSCPPPLEPELLDHQGVSPALGNFLGPSGLVLITEGTPCIGVLKGLAPNAELPGLLIC